MIRSTALLVLCLLPVLFSEPLLAAVANTFALPTLTFKKFDQAGINIKIDGKLDEDVWSGLTVYDQMRMTYPDTLEEVPYRTLARFFYTDRGLYIGVWAEQPKDTLVARLGPRDKQLQRDRIYFALDPTGAGLYGYSFDVHLGGTVSDGTILPERQFNNQWDGPWQGASAEHDEGYSVEFFLPWSMMALPESADPKRTMGFYLARSLAQRGERWTWPALPDSRNLFMSALQKFEVENLKPSKQFTFYPYASAGYDAIEDEDHYKAGFDLYWRPSTNLQISATANPDFGNVESDDVIVNLTSVEVFLPEKRPFFLEGQEIFTTTPRVNARGRASPTILVNTRRIGAPPESIPGLDVSDFEANQPSELQGAVKITGQQSGWRYGLLTAIEDDTKIEGEINDAQAFDVQDGRRFGAARLLYESTAGNTRTGLGWISTLVDHPQGDAIVHGIDGHVQADDGRWGVDGQLLYSDVDDVTGHGGFVDLKYAPRQGLQHSLALDYFDENLEINDFGYMRRNDAIGARYRLRLTESGDLPHLKSRVSSLSLSQEYNNAGQVVRSGVFFAQDREFRNNNFLFTELNYFPSRWDDLITDGNGHFRVDGRWQTGAFFATDQSKPLQLGVGYFFIGEELGGQQHFWELEANWQPSDRFAASFYTAYRSRKAWLLWWEDRDLGTFDATFWQPRLSLDYFISARQQLRLTAQWVGIKADESRRLQVPPGDGTLVPDINPANGDRDFTISTLTFQVRYRWEIAPLSDLFVVYTRGSDIPSESDASFSDLLRNSWKDRAVDVFVVKLRYRLGS
ncbi:MAG: DUF5916 domain-containing protein [Proteobacteria bacterium]|nr:DUF5916 domain-containing protein [Pseudomonadota bacterium]